MAQDAFQDRASHIISRFIDSSGTNPKLAFWYAQTKFYDYKVNGNTAKLAEARKQVSQALDHFNAKDPSFQLWASMDCYLRWGHLYGEALKAKTKDKMINSLLYPSHNTQNKELMAATGRYLAGETWPDASFASGYSPSDPTGKLTLLREMNEYVHLGEQEHNSYTYYALHYGSLRSLGDLAKDPEIKNKAYLTAEWLLVSAAGEWLDGHWAAAAERVYRPFRAQGQYEAGTAHLWLHFGGPYPQPETAEMHNAVQSAVSEYRLPEIIFNVAKDRHQPYTHRETHNHLVTNDRFFYLTSYLNKSYAVFSQHEACQTWPDWMYQMLRWGVCWNQAGGKSIFFVQHPNATNGKNKNQEAGYGETRYGQVLQHEKTLIGVYDIPATDKLPYLKGWIPVNYEAYVDDSEAGRIYLHYGSVMIALCLTEGFEWNAGMENFRKPAGKIGLVVETALPADYSGSTALAQLQSFKQAILRKTRMDASGIRDPKPRLTYTSLQGAVLETTYDPEDRSKNYDKINKQAVDYDHWPLLENPWVKQEYNNPALRLKYGKATRTYDFANWNVSDNTP